MRARAAGLSHAARAAGLTHAGPAPRGFLMRARALGELEGRLYQRVSLLQVLAEAAIGIDPQHPDPSRLIDRGVSMRAAVA